ncbi:MAG: amino acid permease, partial [Actinomycetota bacterium]
RGVGGSALVEIVTVWGKVVLLVGLAVAGLIRFRPEMLTTGIEPRGLGGALIGTASVFMAYEGFQLLTYDYDEIGHPGVTLRRALLSAVIAVTGIYIVVTVGATSLVGAGTLVEEREIALAAAGREAWGAVGVVLVSVAAAFSTGSAINATLFATARLADTVARDGELPTVACHTNAHDVPDRALLGLAGLAAVLAAIGSLGGLVEAASLVFLFTFAVVNVIAVGQLDENRWVPALGAIGATAAVVVLVIQLVRTSLPSLVSVGALILIAALGRPIVLRRTTGTT